MAFSFGFSIGFGRSSWPYYGNYGGFSIGYRSGACASYGATFSAFYPFSSFSYGSCFPTWYSAWPTYCFWGARPGCNRYWW